VNQVTKDTSFGVLLDDCPECVEVLERHGLYCLGCPLADLGSIETGAWLHGIDPDALVEELNAFLAARAGTPDEP